MPDVDPATPSIPGPRDSRDVVRDEPTPPLDEAELSWGFPISGWFGGQPVPDLRRLERERWWDVLLRCQDRVRRMAMTGAPIDHDEGLVLLGELMLAEPPARTTNPRRLAPKLPTPASGDAPVVRSAHQTIRLAEDERMLLRDAARTAGLRPSQLARVLLINGSRAVLREAGVPPGPSTGG